MKKLTSSQRTFSNVEMNANLPPHSEHFQTLAPYITCMLHEFIFSFYLIMETANFILSFSENYGKFLLTKYRRQGYTVYIYENEFCRINLVQKHVDYEDICFIYTNLYQVKENEIKKLLDIETIKGEIEKDELEDINDILMEISIDVTEERIVYEELSSGPFVSQKEQFAKYKYFILSHPERMLVKLRQTIEEKDVSYNIIQRILGWNYFEKLTKLIDERLNELHHNVGLKYRYFKNENETMNFM